MAKKTKVSEAASTDEDTSIVTSLLNAASITVEVASSPSGLNVPDGTDTPESDDTSGGSGDPVAPATELAIEGDTNTPQSASGAAAGEAAVEPVKPLTGSDLIDAMVAQTEIPTFVSTSPEVEAAASGTNSESSSQEAAAGDAGANAGVSAAFTAEQVNAVMAQILGVTIDERREFVVRKSVRHDNVLKAPGDLIVINKAAHAELASISAVSSDWIAGVVVEG